MNILDFAQAILIAFGGIVAVSLFALAVKLFRADKAEYKLNRRRSRSVVATLLGQVEGTHDTQNRDARVHAGLAVNKKNEWVKQGALSDDALDAMLK